MESTETEEGDGEDTSVSDLRSELWVKERELTDIRLEALNSAHQLEQLRDAMNNMQVSFLLNIFLSYMKYILLEVLRVLHLYLTVWFFYLVNGGEPKGGELPFENRNSAELTRAWPCLVHLTTFRSGISSWTVTEAANQHEPHQVLQPQSE